MKRRLFLLLGFLAVAFLVIACTRQEPAEVGTRAEEILEYVSRRLGAA